MTETGRRRTVGSGGNSKGRKEGFGSIRVLPSGRVQARYTGPDGLTHHAPTTFQTKMDARGWLALRHAEIISGKWKPRTSDATMTFRAYATTWLADRPLKPRTRNHYRQLLEQRLLPRFGAVRRTRSARTWCGLGMPTWGRTPRLCDRTAIRCSVRSSPPPYMTS